MESNVMVRDVMTTKVHVVREDTNLSEVIATLSKFDINSLIVVQGKKPVGMITPKDVLIRAFEHGMPIASITAGMVASSPIKSIDESASVEEAAQLMKREKIKRITVTNNGQLVGIISDIDIVFEIPKMLKMMEEVCREK